MSQLPVPDHKSLQVAFEQRRARSLTGLWKFMELEHNQAVWRENMSLGNWSSLVHTNIGMICKIRSRGFMIDFTLSAVTWDIGIFLNSVHLGYGSSIIPNII